MKRKIQKEVVDKIRLAAPYMAREETIDKIYVIPSAEQDMSKDSIFRQLEQI